MSYYGNLQNVMDDSNSQSAPANPYQLLDTVNNPEQSTPANPYQLLDTVDKPQPTQSIKTVDNSNTYSNDFSDEETESPEFLGVNRIGAGSIKLHDKLGNGAFGKVYKGQWGIRPVALKTIDFEHAKHNFPYMTEEDIKESLSWEVSRISAVNHPNCVQFYGIYQNKSGCRSYIVMEFCSNGTLQRKLEWSKNPISWDLRWRWSFEMSKGLHYLHQQGVLHRDLKAENILLDIHGSAKLADLGVAQVDALLDESEAKIVAGLQDKRFIAPENLVQNPSLSTKMTDVYALGLVFWQIAADGKIPRHPNELTNQEKTEWCKQTTNTPYSREQIPEDCNESYKKIILSCWETNPENRPDIQKVIDQLSSIGAEYQQSALIEAIQKLEEILHPKTLEAASFIPPYLTDSQVNESIDQYWARFENTSQPATEDRLSDDSTTKVKEEEKLEKKISLTYFDSHHPESILPATKLSNPPLSLKEIFEEFLCDQTSTLLLFGDSGLGKSLSSHLLAYNLICNFKESLQESVTSLPSSSRLPLLIRPSLSSWSHNQLNNGFQKALNFYGLSKMKQIENIPFLVIVDGYDECILDEIPQNIWKVLKIPTHFNIKVLITCRPKTVTNRIESRFKNPNGKLKVNYFLPFNINQLLNYLKNQLSWDNDKLKKYKDEFKNADQLRSVLRNPFVLSLMAQSWETVTQNIRNLNNLERRHIYEGFVNHWIKTKRALLSENVQKILSSSNTQFSESYSNDILLFESFQRFASEVAFQSFLEGDISLSQAKIKLKSIKSEWLGIDSLIQKESEDFFKTHNKHSSDDKKSSSGRRSLLTINDYVQIKKTHLNQFQIMSPLKCRSGTYEFSHKSFFEYFAAKYILLLSKEKEKKSIITKLLVLLNKLSLRQEPEILKFWIEGFNKQERDTLVQPLFDIIKLSRENGTLCQAASNAATLLATARVSFSGQDLSGVNIQDADLTGVILHHTSFKHACLKGVVLGGAFLGNTDFRGACMNEISFGEYPKLVFEDDFKDVSYSSDGSLVIAVGDKINIKNTNLNQIDDLMIHEKVTCVILSPDGKILASGSKDKTVRLWDVERKKPLAELKGHTEAVNCVSFSPDGKTLASGSEDKTVILWDVKSQKPLGELKGHTSSVSSVSFSPDGKTLASGSFDKTVILWDIESQKPLAEMKDHTDCVASVSFSPDGKTLASGSWDNTVRLWDVEDQKPLAELKGHGGWINCVLISPDGKTLASASDDKIVRLWDVESQKFFAELKHAEAVASVSFSPDGKTLASGSKDKTVRLWDVESQRPLTGRKGHTDLVNCVSFSPDGKTLASGSQDNTVKLWDIENQKPLAELKDHTECITSISFSPDGKTLASGSFDKTVILWDIESQKALAVLMDHTDYVTRVLFSPDGKTLASGSRDNTVRLWDVESQKPLVKQLEDTTSVMEGCSFSPDGKTLAYGNQEGSIILWDVESQKLLAELKGHSAPILCVSFSPDGKTLASGGWDNLVILWDIESQKLLAELNSHAEAVSSVSFSQDCKTLASGSWDSTIILWDVESQKSLAELKGHNAPLNCVSFSPDGKTLASGSWDKSVRLWDIESKKPLAELKDQTESVNSDSWHPTLQLQYSTYLELYAANCLLTEKDNISPENLLLLNQLGGKGE